MSIIDPARYPNGKLWDDFWTKDVFQSYSPAFKRLLTKFSSEVIQPHLINSLLTTIDKLERIQNDTRTTL